MRSHTSRLTLLGACVIAMVLAARLLLIPFNLLNYALTRAARRALAAELEHS